MGQLVSFLSNKQPTVEHSELIVQDKTLLSVVSKNKDNVEFLKPHILKLCKEYMNDHWKNLNLDDFVIYKPWLL
jgi:hypothetical protein